MIESLLTPRWRAGQGPSDVHDGYCALGAATDWSWIEASDETTAALSSLRNFVIQVSVSGEAEAAGISFGHYKDFLVPIERTERERVLQLEVDANARNWVFRVDGRLMPREWWDAAIRSAEDILAGNLALKAFKSENVVFRDFTIRRFDSSCRVSVVMSCYRFSQRLRISLHNWCRQTLPTGAVEILVANPQSPDATHELLSAITCAYPDVRLCEVPIDGGMARNKGFMINRAVDASRGEWIWFTDADCLFPLNAVEHALTHVNSHSALYYGERRHLPRLATDSLLAGRADPGHDFERVSAAAYHTERFPWGYTQIIHRSRATSIRYREDIDNFSTSDGAFIEDCRVCGVLPRPIPGLSCLHLSHPFAWYGTGLYL